MRFLTFSLFALFLAGCAGYHVGPVKPKTMKGITTIAVPNFKNDTVVPRIEVLVAGSIVKQIQQDGTYKIAHEANADAILEGRITEIRRTPARSVHGDVLSTREFKLVIRIEYKLHNRATGEELMHRNVNGSTSFFVGGDVNADERQAIPLAVEQAAVSIVSQISEGW